MKKTKRTPKYCDAAIKVNGDVYYYEEWRGLYFVTYVEGGTALARFTLPWKLIEASLKTRRAVVSHRKSKKS